jgi:hypothetical protein
MLKTYKDLKQNLNSKYINILTPSKTYSDKPGSNFIFYVALSNSLSPVLRVSESDGQMLNKFSQIASSKVTVLES